MIKTYTTPTHNQSHWLTCRAPVDSGERAALTSRCVMMAATLAIGLVPSWSWGRGEAIGGGSWVVGAPERPRCRPWRSRRLGERCGEQTKPVEIGIRAWATVGTHCGHEWHSRRGGEATMTTVHGEDGHSGALLGGEEYGSMRAALMEWGDANGLERCARTRRS
jgi:hypothetical protein